MDGSTSITLRISSEVRRRHAAAAVARGYTLARHLADVLAHVDPEALPVAPGEDELTRLRRQQLVALEAAGLADESVRAMLEPARLPSVLAEALTQSKKGGPGMRHFGSVLAGQLAMLLPEAVDEIDEIAELPYTSGAPSRIAIARLAELLSARLPIVLAAVDRHHHEAVMRAAIDALRACSSEAPHLEAVQ